MGPPYGVSSFPASSFDFVQDESRAGGSFGTPILSGACPGEGRGRSTGAGSASCRRTPRRPPGIRCVGTEVRASHLASSPTRSVWGPIPERCGKCVMSGVWDESATIPPPPNRTDPRWAPGWPAAIGGDDLFVRRERPFPIRRTAPHAMMVICPSGSRIRYRSGRECRDRRVRARAAVRSAPRQVRPG